MYMAKLHCRQKFECVHVNVVMVPSVLMGSSRGAAGYLNYSYQALKLHEDIVFLYSIFIRKNWREEARKE